MSVRAVNEPRYEKREKAGLSRPSAKAAYPEEAEEHETEKRGSGGKEAVTHGALCTSRYFVYLAVPTGFFGKSKINAEHNSSLPIQKVAVVLG